MGAGELSVDTHPGRRPLVIKEPGRIRTGAKAARAYHDAVRQDSRPLPRRNRPQLKVAERHVRDCPDPSDERTRPEADADLANWGFLVGSTDRLEGRWAARSTLTSPYLRQRKCWEEAAPPFAHQHFRTFGQVRSDTGLTTNARSGRGLSSRCGANVARSHGAGPFA